MLQAARDGKAHLAARLESALELMTSHYQNPGEPWMPCINSRLIRSEFPSSNGYFIIEENGGLNHQQLSICDAVVVASLLNATLVIPTFHLNSVWHDPRVVRIAPFSNRLARSVPLNIQALRYLVNYHALRFAEPIRDLAEDLVGRMIKKSSLTGGKYVSVHLRFEEDMVAISCCTYYGGWKEKTEMYNARERSWRGKFGRHGRVINPEANRRDGKCPLTPLEVRTLSYRYLTLPNPTASHLALLRLCPDSFAFTAPPAPAYRCALSDLNLRVTLD